MPVAPFPRWMVCPGCRCWPRSVPAYLNRRPRLSSRQGLLRPQLHHPGKSPTVVPARFLTACKHGHLDDFPWLNFVHRGKTDCRGPLRMYELGVSGEAADVEVKCDKCGAVRRMAEAFGL